MKTIGVLLALGMISVAQADYNFTCTDAKYGVQNHLTIRGSGQQAQIHIESVTVSGDLTLNPTAPAMPGGYEVFSGMCTDKIDTPPTQLQGAFLFQPALFQGQPANMEQFANDGFLTLACTLDAVTAQ